MTAAAAPMAARRGVSGRPALIVVVDTEEEFDWNAPFDRASTSVTHMREIGRLQDILERHAVKPVYLIDYPIATQEPALGALTPLIRESRALLGAHLHPWVSPPHDEVVTRRHSFPGNLPADLEQAKLALLGEAIEAAFGIRPTMYKAGRYGIGPNSFAILERLGFDVDLSPAPPFDYRREEGPDFSARGLAPRWEGPAQTVLSIPGTGALVGWAPLPALYQALTVPAIRRFRGAGIAARLGAVERLKLSPEGHTAEEMLRLVRFLIGRGQNLFVLSLHSPSVAPGHTPYARTVAERDRLLAELDGFLGVFMGQLGGIGTEPALVRAAFDAEH
jgi:hypothetical protein